MPARYVRGVDDAASQRARVRCVILVVAHVSSILAQPYIWATATLVDEFDAGKL